MTTIRGIGDEDGEEPAAIPIEPEKKGQPRRRSAPANRRLSGRFNLKLGMQVGSNWPVLEVDSEGDGMVYAFRLAIIVFAGLLVGGVIFTLLNLL